MDRYSRLCQISRNGSDSAHRELGCSKELNHFLRQLGIVNLQQGFDEVAQTLSDFRKLSDLEGLTGPERPMLIRCCPIELARRPGWASDVKPFLALCGTGADSAGTVYTHTVFIRPETLLHDGDLNYLDHLFGTRFAGPEGADPEDLDLPPARVDPDLRPDDKMLVILAAAALLKNRPIVLKLERDCVFNRRAMDLLSQIYSLLPPALAIQTGFSSYQDPRQFSALMRDTPIRIFLTHADCVCSASDPQYLFFDLNQPVKLQTAAQQAKDFAVNRNLLTYITYWYSLPWRERQPLMKLLFADEKTLPNEQSYCSVTRNFVSEPFIQWINRLPDRGTFTSLEQLKEKYDSFPLCGRIPILREKFCLAVSELLQPSVNLAALGADLRMRLDNTGKDADDYNQLQELYSFYQLIQAVRTAAAARKSASAGSAPNQSASELIALQEAHAGQIRQMEQAFADEIAKLQKENQSLRDAHEKVRIDMETAFTWKLHETEQTFADQLTKLKEENQSLQKSHEKARMAMEQDLTWQLHETEQAFSGQINKLLEENQALRKHQGNTQAALSQEQTAQIQQLREEAEAAKAKLRLSQEKLTQLIRDRDTDKARMEESFAKEITMLQAENAYLRTVQEEEQAAMEQSFADKVRQLRRETEAARAELQRAQAERDQILRDWDITMQVHADELEKLKTENQSVDAALEAQRAELEQQHLERTMQLRAETEAAQEKLRLAQIKITQLIRDRDAAMEQAEQVHSEELAKLRAENQSVTAALESQRAELEQQHMEKITQLQEELEAAKKKYRLTREDFNREVLAATEMQKLLYFDRIRQLETETETAKEKLQLAQEKISQLVRDRDTAIEQVRQSTADQIAQLTDENQSLRAQADDVTTLKQQHDAQIEQMRRDADSAQEKLRLAQGKITQLIRDRDAAMEQAEQVHSDELAKLRAENQSVTAALESQRAELEQQYLAQLQAEMEAAKKKYRLTREDFNREVLAATEMQKLLYFDRIRQLETETETAKEKLQLAQEKISQLVRDRDAAMKQKEQSFAAEIAQLKEENQTLRKNQDSMQSEQTALLQQLREEANSSKARLHLAQEKITQLIQERDDAIEQIQQSVDDQIAQLCKENQQLRTENSAARHELRLAQDKFSQLIQDRDKSMDLMQSEIEDLNTTHEAAWDALEQQHAEQIKELNCQKKDLERHLAQIQDAYSRLQREFQDTNCHLSAQIQDRENKLSALEQKYKAGIDDANNRIRKLNQQHKEKEAEFEKRRKADIDGANDAIRNALQQRDDALARLQKLEDDLRNTVYTSQDTKRIPWWKK